MTSMLTVNGIVMNVTDEGHGPPVLLVHGFPDDHTVWRRQIPALVAAGYRVVAPDMRGCGESQIMPNVSDYKLPNLVADLAALLDQLGIPKVRLVGHDWGAVISWRFCMAHPQRVDRFAALSVGHPTAYARGPLEQKLKGYYILLFQLRGVAEWLLRAADWAIFRFVTRCAEEAPNWIAKLSRPGRLTAAISYYRANLGIIWPRPWPKVEVPVMGMFSDGDLFLSEAQMRDTKKYVSGPFRYEHVRGANHWLQLAAPDRVNSLLLDFLR